MQYDLGMTQTISTDSDRRIPFPHLERPICNRLSKTIQVGSSVLRVLKQPPRFNSSPMTQKKISKMVFEDGNGNLIQVLKRESLSSMEDEAVPVGFARQSYAKGLGLRVKGEEEKALEAFQETLRLLDSEKTKSSIDRVSILYEIAVSSEKLGRKEAASYYETIAKVSEPSLDRIDFPHIYYQTGRFLEKINKVEEALSAYQTATKIAEHLSIQHPATSFRLAVCLGQLGRPDEAIKAYNKTIQLLGKIKKKNHFKNVSICYTNIGREYNSLKKLDQSVTCFSIALEMLQKHVSDDKELIATAFFNLGLAYMTSGEQEKAIDYYKKALAIDETAGADSSTIAEKHFALALTYESMNKAKEALEHMQKSIALREEESNHA